MVKHNNVVPKGHFKKHWQNRVKTWFDQPARKKRRHTARLKKAVRIFPRPISGPLRPIVRGQTVKYNMKVRAGRGFSLEELKAGGISKQLATTIGISVDHRRKNRSLEGFQVNAQRLKMCKAKTAFIPMQPGKQKNDDASKEELASVTQIRGIPIVCGKSAVELTQVTDEMKAFNAFQKIRIDQTNKRYMGARLKKASEAEKDQKK